MCRFRLWNGMEMAGQSAPHMASSIDTDVDEHVPGQQGTSCEFLLPLFSFRKALNTKEGRSLSIEPKDRMTGGLKDEVGKRGRGVCIKKGADRRALGHTLQKLFQNRGSLFRIELLRAKRLVLAPTPDLDTSGNPHIAHPLDDPVGGDQPLLLILHYQLDRQRNEFPTFTACYCQKIHVRSRANSQAQKSYHYAIEKTSATRHAKSLSHC
jgi:hypothetical protein